MNRELQQVRRYWPKAKMSCQLLADGAVVWTLYAADRSERLRIVVYADGRAVAGKWAMATRLQQTIPEAMRAAGFGLRPLGKHARERVKRSEYRKQLMGHAALGPSWAAGAARLLAYYQPRLADRQRPRKGARLGRRKREVQP